MEQESNSKKDFPPEHYYGDIVRQLFLAAGLIMLIIFPFFSSVINIPLYVTVFATVLVASLAGLQNPKHRLITIFNALASIIGCITFEYVAITYAEEFTSVVGQPFFWVNQVLAVIFFFAIYYSSKTLRGVVFKKNSSKIA